jgi:hypothetical protein
MLNVNKDGPSVQVLETGSPSYMYIRMDIKTTFPKSHRRTRESENALCPPKSRGRVFPHSQYFVVYITYMRKSNTTSTNMHRFSMTVAKGYDLLICIPFTWKVPEPDLKCMTEYFEKGFFL